MWSHIFGITGVFFMLKSPAQGTDAEQLTISLFTVVH